MSAPSNNDSVIMNAALEFPSRSSAVANNADGSQNVVATLQLHSDNSTKAIATKRNIYVSMIAPNDTMLPNAKAGDMCICEYVDDGQTTNPYDVDLYLKTSNGWKKLLTAEDDSVSLEHLDSGITPTHIIVGGGVKTTVGGDTREEITVAGMLAGDIAMVSVKAYGSSPTTLKSYVPSTLGQTIVVTWEGDPSTDHVVSYLVYRAAA